jgi:orotate phosphoribosyltransferase
LLAELHSPLRFRSLTELNSVVLRELSRFSGQYDLIAGVPRSGMLVASLLGLYLNLPVISVGDMVAGFWSSRYTGRRLSGGRARTASPSSVLVADDAVGTGQTIAAVRSALAAAPVPDGMQVEYLAAFATKGGRKHVDQYLELVEPPRVFEWNLLHHSFTRLFCVDMDGVICRDPVADENDDGERYRKFLVDAAPRALPSQPVGAVVTARLEKYRDLTVDWLARHGVRYRRLIMLNLGSADDRRRMAAHAQMKADVFQRLNAPMFIESDPHQAREIHRLTGRPVFCIASSELHQQKIPGP